jgi:predicted O-linked N-acetylglucosamine transferase (SPINDLY family)
LRLKKVQKKRAEKKAPYFTWPKDWTKSIPTVNRNAWLRGIADRDPKVWNAIIDYCFFFEQHHYKMFAPEGIKELSEFVQLTYTALATEGFFPVGENAINLVQVGHLFQHLVAVTGFETNDGTLRNQMLHKDNLVKVLFLQNPRCEFQLDQKKIFELNPQLASLWFGVYMAGTSTPTRRIQQNIYNHLANMDDRYSVANHRQTAPYFTCTYHAPDHALAVKSKMNAGIQRAGVPQFENNPDPNAEQKHIAIITNRWHRNHAVYKSAGPLVEQLVGKYKLTLIWTQDGEPDTIVKDYFDAVHHCYFTKDGQLVLPDEFVKNDYDMVYFPDVGMSDESIWLSNSRIAPIQACGYGHPDSTGANNHMDYFVCGDVEKDADYAYTETRVCLPGLAQEPAWPTAEKEDNYIDDDVVRINCVWGPDKYNRTLLEILAAINQTVAQRCAEEDRPAPEVEFHFFTSPGIHRYASVPSFAFEVSRLLPNVKMHTDWEYYDYMREMQKHDFALNSFQFGCYNVLTESLWAGIPFLTLVGDRFYNRAGMWLNDQVGLSENNFNIPREFVNGVADLILDPERLKAQRQHLKDIDLKECLYTLKGDYFLEAIEYIFANHPFTETKIIGEEYDEAN